MFYVLLVLVAGVIVALDQITKALVVASIPLGGYVEAIPGLFVGCLLSNLVGGYGVMDIVFGSAATLIAALATYFMRKLPAWIAVLPVVLVNALIVGYFTLHLAAGLPFWPSALSVGLGQAVVVYVLGLPLHYALKKFLPEKFLH